MHLVIMAGGSGTRFWPKSTSKRPKQLLPLAGKTLLRQTLDRFEGLVPRDRRWIVTTEALSRAIAQDAPEARILAEPQARNTAPCVYWAAREIAKIDPKAVMLMMPADHYIPREEAFREAVAAAAKWAESHDDLVTLGVAPTRPETGYGYLKLGSALPGGARQVERFVEKPSLDRAQQFLKEGGYAWNGGMFVWRAEVVLKAFDQAMPEMKRAWEAAQGDALKAYPQLTATSIDFGVMEKAKNVVAFDLECGWDDLGSWTSLENIAHALNAQSLGGVVTAGELIALESQGNIVDAPDRVVVTLGVSDLIIVENGRALLVAHKNRAQEIKKAVDAVKVKHPDLV